MVPERVPSSDVVSLLREADISPPATDCIFYLREQ